MTTQNVAVRRVGAAVLVLAVVLAACDRRPGTTTTPQGPAGNAKRETLAVLGANAQLDDRPFEKRGEQQFWVISYGSGGQSRAVGSGCDETVTQSLAVGGGFGAGLFLGNVGDIVVPIDGGTVPLAGSQGTGRSSGSATLTVTKKT